MQEPESRGFPVRPGAPPLAAGNSKRQYSLHMHNQSARWPVAAWVAAGLAGLAVCLAICIVVLVALIPSSARHPYWPFNVAVAVGFSLAGFAIVRRQPANLIGWIFLAGAVGNGLAGAGVSYAAYDLLARQGSLPGADLVVGVIYWAWLPIPASIAFTLALFPDGRPLPPRWRPLLYVLGAGFLLWAVGGATSPFPIQDAPLWAKGLRNPLNLPFGPELSQVGNGVALAGVGAAAVAMLPLFRRPRWGEPRHPQWSAPPACPA